MLQQKEPPEREGRSVAIQWRMRHSITLSLSHSLSFFRSPRTKEEEKKAPPYYRAGEGRRTGHVGFRKRGGTGFYKLRSTFSICDLRTFLPWQHLARGSPTVILTGHYRYYLTTMMEWEPLCLHERFFLPIGAYNLLPKVFCK
jgi:hypothetical protein